MNERFFTTFEEARKWAMESTRNVFTRSTDGDGFIPKKPVPTPEHTTRPEPARKFVHNPNPPYSGRPGQLYLVQKVSTQTAESMVGSVKMLELEKIIRPGDELWEFTSSGKDWEYLAGQSGLSVVRDDEIVCQVVTMMS